MVEHIIGNDEVEGPIPSSGTSSNFITLGIYEDYTRTFAIIKNALQIKGKYHNSMSTKLCSKELYRN